MEGKDQNAKTMAEVIFVSTTREDHDVRIVGRGGGGGWNLQVQPGKIKMQRLWWK